MATIDSPILLYNPDIKVRNHTDYDMVYNNNHQPQSASGKVLFTYRPHLQSLSMISSQRSPHPELQPHIYLHHITTIYHIRRPEIFHILSDPKSLPSNPVFFQSITKLTHSNPFPFQPNPSRHSKKTWKILTHTLFSNHTSSIIHHNNPNPPFTRTQSTIHHILTTCIHFQ